MIPVDLDPESDSESDASAVVENDLYLLLPHAPSVVSASGSSGQEASEEVVHQLLLCGRPPPGLTRGGGASASSSGSVAVAAVESQLVFGERHVSRPDIGTITFVVGLSEDTVGSLVRVPWHSIVVGVSCQSIAWIATDCDRAPFVAGRLPTDLRLAMDVPLPVFAARSSFVDCAVQTAS